jgi:hypothetical protein
VEASVEGAERSGVDPREGLVLEVGDQNRGALLLLPVSELRCVGGVDHLARPVETQLVSEGTVRVQPPGARAIGEGREGGGLPAHGPEVRAGKAAASR